MEISKEAQVLSAIRKSDPKKKRVTFFISKEVKNILAIWCNKNDVTESAAIEQMICSTIPGYYFKSEEIDESLSTRF